MKTSVEIQGLPIFSLVDGAEIGHVKQLVVNPQAGRVDLVVVENEQEAVGVQILPYTSVIGVGDFAMTVETGDAIQDLALLPDARPLVLLGYKVVGTRVLSRRGQLLGHVNEYFVDTDSGEIHACSYEESGASGEVKLFDRPNIKTFGRDVIVINEESQVFTSFAEREAAATAEQTPVEIAEVPKAETPTVLAPVPSSESLAERTPATPDGSSDTVVAVGPYAYLVGKTLREDLHNEAGTLLAPQGSRVTPELIERVKSDSPTLFMKLNRLVGE